ncbi:MAG: prolipoprotein diacylglyceryl transferase [Patescibacteria group bacterium]|jgi:phosphatidylglycerol:prolipoprotein diacylglycerol transferase
MTFLATATPPEVLLTLGGLTIHWYAFWITLGAIAGFLLLKNRARVAGITNEQTLDITLLVLIFGFIGARLYHVFNEPIYYLEHLSEIPAIWNGGMAIHGGILAGAVALWWYARKKGHALNPTSSVRSGAGLSFLSLLDTVAPALLLGQAIGRWGNYFNQELFGGPTELPWKLFIAAEHRPEGYENTLFFHPTFLYESLGLFVIAAALLFFWKRFRAPGMMAFSALAASQILRFGTETLRIDRTPEILGARLPLLMSIILFIVSLIALLYIHRHATPSTNRS